MKRKVMFLLRTPNQRWPTVSGRVSILTKRLLISLKQANRVLQSNRVFKRSKRKDQRSPLKTNTRKGGNHQRRRGSRWMAKFSNRKRLKNNKQSWSGIKSQTNMKSCKGSKTVVTACPSISLKRTRRNSAPSPRTILTNTLL